MTYFKTCLKTKSCRFVTDLVFV